MNIKDILARDPEEILALSEPAIQALLAPFFPQVRTPALPPEKARKLGVERRMVESYVKSNMADIKKQLEAMKKGMK